MANTHARALRHDSTDAERALWHILRARRFLGYKFRRQHPIGPFIADFACVARRLVIEADGGQRDADTAADARRTAWLERDGWRLVRLWNNEILGQPGAVVERIGAGLMEAAGEAPSPAGLRPATSPAKRER